MPLGYRRRPRPDRGSRSGGRCSPITTSTSGPTIRIRHRSVTSRPRTRERYRRAADAAGVSELGVSEHIHRFSAALEIWRHPFWVEQASDDLDAYCEFVAGTDLRLGIEADYVAGAEDRIEAVLGARDFDYVIGSVHFIGEGAVDQDRWDVWETRARRSRSRLGALLRAARRRRGERPLRCDRPPRPGQGLGRGPAGSRAAIRATTTSRRSPRSPRPAWRRRSPPPACASPSPSSTRRRRWPRMLADAGVPFALSSDAHRPEEVGYAYDRAVQYLSEIGVGEIATFEAARAADGATRMSLRVGIGYDSHRFVERAPADPRRGRDSLRARPRRATPTPTCVTHAVIDALLGACGQGDIGRSVSRPTTSAGRGPTRSRCCETVLAELAGGAGQRRRDRDLRGAEAGPAPRGDRAAARRGGRRPGLGQGDDQRADGLRSGGGRESPRSRSRSSRRPDGADAAGAPRKRSSE